MPSPPATLFHSFPENTENNLRLEPREEIPDVSIVIPVYDEAGAIEDVIIDTNRVLKDVCIDYEIIVVDDGSQDGTLEKILECSKHNNHVRALTNHKNMGKGVALRNGFSSAVGNAIILLDGDGDLDSRQMKRFIEALQIGDLVIASKWHPQSSVSIPLVRKILSRIFNLLVQILTGIRLSDTQTGLKAIRKEALKKISEKMCVKRYAFDVELLTLARLHNLKIVELPVKIRMNGIFHLKEIWHIFIDLLAISYRLRILKYYRSE